MNFQKNIYTELFMSEQTYKEASSKIKSKAIKSFLEELAKSKSRFRKQLSIEKNEEIRPERTNNPKVAVETTDAQKILIQCLNEEENLIRQYQKTLNTKRLGQNHYKILSVQLNNALKAFNQLRAIKLSTS